MAKGSKRNLYFAATVACLTAALFGYSVGFIGGVLVLPSFLRHFHLDELNKHDLAAAQSATVSLWLVGALLGVPMGMPFYSRLGRRRCMTLSAGFYIIGAALQLTDVGALGIEVFDAGRFLNGLGVGAGTLVSPLYIAEISPPDSRGMLMSGYQVSLQISALIGFWGAFVCHAIIPSTSSAEYQIPVALQLVPGVLLILGTLLIPEAPRYLAEQGKHEELRDAVARLRALPYDDPDVTREVEEVCRAVEVSRAAEPKRKGFLQEASEPNLRRKLGVGIGLMVAQNMMGLNAINYYAPIIFISAGFSTVSASLFLTGMYGLVKVLSAIGFMFVFVRVKGNRFWLIWGAAACGVCMIILAVCVQQLPTPDPKEPPTANISALGVIAVLAVYVFSFFFSVSFGPISWNVCGEIFPLHINAVCCAITTSMQWLFQIVIAGITPRLIATIGYRTYLVYAACCFISLIWAVFCVPETRNVPLGAPMDRLFGDKSKADDEEGRAEEIEEIEEVSETTSLLGNQRRNRSASRARRGSMALVI